MANLLLYENRFRKETLSPIDIYEISGYQKAMMDFLQLLGETTEFNPARRLVDSVPLIESINETNKVLTHLIGEEKKLLLELASDPIKASLAGVRLSGYKVDNFLKAQVQDGSNKDI